MTSKFKEIINIFEKTGFLKFPNSSSSTKYEQISLGPFGYLLQENLKTEWLHSNLTNRDISVFLNNSDNLKESFNFVKEICQERLPFGIVQIVNDNKPSIGEIIDGDTHFQLPDQVKMESHIFVSPINSAQYFYNWQKQRRMWWRKFSASPARYSFTDVTISEEGEQNVEIVSEFSWGSQIMEKLCLYPNGHPGITKEQLKTKDGKKYVTAHSITSTAYLSSMVLNTLCDAFDERLPSQDEKRPLLRFHRKLAPYKVSFAISTSSNTEELNDLALFLCKKLRKSNVSALLLPSASKHSLESQWIQYDQIGIPYCAILNDSTLRSGIAYLRSLDTTLKEQVHVSDLPAYVKKLCKN